jgi:hypothetical protein
MDHVFNAHTHTPRGVTRKSRQEQATVKWNIWRALVLVSTLVSAVMAAGADSKWY